MNEHGYLGASVQKISEHLNLTKGAFYHHLENKDDLIAACFQRKAAEVHSWAPGVTQQNVARIQVRPMFEGLMRGG